MLQLKRNDLLIGFTISVLLSIFVNFALLMRKYEFETGNPSMGIQPPDRTMYYLLIWFFVFSFILFIVNSLMYKFGDKLFRRKEYKRVLVVCVTCISIAYGMFHLSPVLYTAIVVEWLGEDGPQPATRDIMIRINRDRMATQTIRPAEHRDIPVPPNPFTVPNSFMTEHLFVFLTVMLSSILIRLLGSKQQMKLEYEQLKTEKLQNSYNALMGQINPHFFFNSLNGLNALIQSGEKQQTLAYLDELQRLPVYLAKQQERAGYASGRTSIRKGVHLSAKRALRGKAILLHPSGYPLLALVSADIERTPPDRERRKAQRYQQAIPTTDRYLYHP